MKFPFLSLALLSLLGCVSNTRVATVDRLGSCEAKGNRIDPYTGECLSPTIDAGQPCSDTKQCDGYCSTDKLSLTGSHLIGTCSGFKSRSKEPNCGQHLINGVVVASASCIN
jgi:hypothetical protein